MSHFVTYMLQFQEIIVYKIPPGGRGSIASLRSLLSHFTLKLTLPSCYSAICKVQTVVTPVVIPDKYLCDLRIAVNVTSKKLKL